MLLRATANLIDDVGELLGNARKIVFIIFAGATVAFTAAGILGSDVFEKIVLIVFTYFFTTKGEGEDAVG